METSNPWFLNRSHTNLSYLLLKAPLRILFTSSFPGPGHSFVTLHTTFILGIFQLYHVQNTATVFIVVLLKHRIYILTVRLLFEW